MTVARLARRCARSATARRRTARAARRRRCRAPRGDGGAPPRWRRHRRAHREVDRGRRRSGRTHLRAGATARAPDRAAVTSAACTVRARDSAGAGRSPAGATCSVEEAGVERCVVGGEQRTFEPIAEFVERVVERAAPVQVSAGDAVDLGGPDSLQRPTQLDEDDHSSRRCRRPDDDQADLEHAVSTRRQPGGLQVDDGECGQWHVGHPRQGVSQPVVAPDRPVRQVGSGRAGSVWPGSVSSLGVGGGRGRRWAPTP